MAEVYKLCNKFMHYEWGSLTLIPEFLDIKNDKNTVYAEMWMGTHKGAPSQISNKNLSEISGDLPFLFKLLAIDKPLSIQAHPDKKQAEEGFKREDKAMLPVNAPSRNYKDDNHKPEIFCAIEPSILMAGFREPDKIRGSFLELASALPQLNEILSPFINILKTGSLQQFFMTLFSLSKLEQEFLCSSINQIEEIKTGENISPEQWKLIKKFTSIYPYDPAILSPLYLNCMSLMPCQAVYIPAGILHAYINGFGVEVMANSDNVLRGGLTPKHVDAPQLMNILKFVPFIPEIITPQGSNGIFYYHTPCKDFQLVRMKSGKNAQAFESCGPAICLVTQGEVMIDGIAFKKGESFFIKADGSPVLFNGNYSLFAASLFSGDYNPAQEGGRAQ